MEVMRLVNEIRHIDHLISEIPKLKQQYLNAILNRNLIVDEIKFVNSHRGNVNSMEMGKVINELEIKLTTSCVNVVKITNQYMMLNNTINKILG